MLFLIIRVSQLFELIKIQLVENISRAWVLIQSQTRYSSSILSQLVFMVDFSVLTAAVVAVATLFSVAFQF